MNAWELEEPEEIVAGRNHIARLLNQEEEGAFECDNIPVMPFGYYKGQKLDGVNKFTLIAFYHLGNLDCYEECKDWVKANCIDPELEKLKANS